MTEEEKKVEKEEIISEEKDVITIAGAPPEEKEESGLIKDLRKNQRETSRENKKLKAEMEKMSSTNEKSVELGTKPTLEGSDYDAEKYATKLETWHDKKSLHEGQLAKESLKKQKETDEWNQKLASHAEKAESLNVENFKDAQLLVQETFTETQQGLIIDSVDNSAHVVYALGTNPKIAKELSSITNHVKFIAAIAKLEGRLTVEKRKSVTEPEKKVVGSAPTGGGADSQLEKLREEAKVSNDYSKVTAYKRKIAASQN